MKRNRSRKLRRKGNIIVLSAFILIGLMAMIALSVDVGVLCTAKQQLQRTADSAAMAACWRLLDEDATTGFVDPSIVEANARDEAGVFAAMNDVLSQEPQLSQSDVTVGYLANPFDRSSSLVVGSASPANAVTVRVRRADDINGSVPLFFARALGTTDVDMQAEATAVLLTSVKGFETPSNGDNLMILPFALDEGTWDQLLKGPDSSGDATDDWTWDPGSDAVVEGSDESWEVNLFPQGTGSPGNRGTVDIGSSNNSTNDIARQILEGITPADMAYHDGKLECDEDPTLCLNGDTGISAGVKDELASIIGQPRMIPIFRKVTGNGNNATYTIIGFQGIRIMEVKLTGSMSKKRVIIQAASCVTRGGIPGGDGQYSSHIFSPVWLVR